MVTLAEQWTTEANGPFTASCRVGVEERLRSRPPTNPTTQYLSKLLFQRVGRQHLSSIFCKNGWLNIIIHLDFYSRSHPKLRSWFAPPAGPEVSLFLFSALLRSVLSEKRLPDGGGHRWAPILTRSYGLPAEPGHCKCQRFAKLHGGKSFIHSPHLT